MNPPRSSNVSSSNSIAKNKRKVIEDDLSHPTYDLLTESNRDLFQEHMSCPNWEDQDEPCASSPTPQDPQPTTSQGGEQPPPEMMEEDEQDGGNKEKQDKFHLVFEYIDIIEGAEAPPNKINPGGGGVLKIKKFVTLTSPKWIHFNPVWDPSIRKLKGRCKYCSTLIIVSGKSHGSSGLGKHYNSCKKKPGVDSTTAQTKLKLHPTTGAVENWSFNQDRAMESVCKWLIEGGRPFSEVDKPSFRRMMAELCPWLDLTSRRTVTRKCYKMYLAEKQRLKIFIKDNAQRVCFTTDTWTSLTRDNYMALTAHFIDNEWKLRKRIINFCLISGHTGDDIAADVDKCLRDWWIDKIMTITVDNAYSNDSGIAILTNSLLHRQDATILNGKFVQVRCIAHIINLVVQDGLKSLGRDDDDVDGEDGCSVDRIRLAVKYVNKSPARFKKFRRCITDVGITTRQLVSQDVTTRWNSTYDMLKTAVFVKKAFVQLAEVDRNYRKELGVRIPRLSDWDRAEKFVEFLEPFKKLTENVSGTNYVTSNEVFTEICTIDDILGVWLEGDDEELKTMARVMKEKYDKYWGVSEKMNHMLYYAVIIDPRYKSKYFTHMIEFEDLKIKIMTGFTALFNEYKEKYGETEIPSSSRHNETSTTTSRKRGKNPRHEAYLRMQAETQQQPRSELDQYFEEATEVIVEGKHFEVLEWWKGNNARFPILSKIARDLLAIPASTVPSESAFSAGGRILNKFRSSLTPRLVQVLVCYQDWLLNDVQPVKVEEDLLELEQLEEEFAKLGRNSSILED